MNELANRQAGIVYWITGLSGAGKSTIAKLLFDKLISENPRTILLDGDTLRAAISSDLGYGEADRLQSAMRNARLCQLLSNQGVDVICATISLFHSCQNWNRKHIKNYIEVYVRASFDTLASRDPKKIYSRATNGNLTNVYGIDLKVEEPVNPDLIIDSKHSDTPIEHVESILEWRALWFPKCS